MKLWPANIWWGDISNFQKITFFVIFKISQIFDHDLDWHTQYYQACSNTIKHN